MIQANVMEWESTQSERINQVLKKLWYCAWEIKGGRQCFRRQTQASFSKTYSWKPTWQASDKNFLLKSAEGTLENIEYLMSFPCPFGFSLSTTNVYYQFNNLDQLKNTQNSDDIEKIKTWGCWFTLRSQDESEEHFLKYAHNRTTYSGSLRNSYSMTPEREAEVVVFIENLCKLMEMNTK